VLRTAADQPMFWERFLPKELRRLSMELARVDALLDDPVFFAPFERFSDPRRVGRLRLAPTRSLGESVITKRIDADRKAGAQGASWWRRNPMARVMARPRRAVTQKQSGCTARWQGRRAMPVRRHRG
jgi:hypothetical protein